MSKLCNLEFQLLPEGEVEIRPLNGQPYQLQESNNEFIDEFIEILKNDYTEAYTALSKTYSKSSSNLTYYRFLIVRRFIKCNFPLLDNQADIDAKGNFIFEYVNCPLQGECKLWKVCCRPKFNNRLTNQQLTIARLLVEGSTPEEIADDLFISIHTVTTHRNNIYKKLNLHSVLELSKHLK